ncbi:hypothetical protein C0Q70_11795 [Pomacea canaliculata]|uniref:G-protein coupled receptors family 1 profile domain-containing protein n=1 Tax=Pomacea canaliculata TaxID=400727 RepID=A0A2T7P6Z5_POMCA|nr:hypothetical protein C0Q70_11795 [Pomacea canaliculata]
MDIYDLSLQVSAFSLCLITLDIYLEITHQKWYRNWLNTPKVVIALCAVWVIPLAVNTWPLTPTLWPQLVEIDKDQCVFRAAPLLVYTSVTFDFLLPGVCITVLYVFVFCYCRKRLQSSKVTRMDYADFCRIFDPFEYRTLIVMGIQVFAFVVLWMPFWIYTCLVASYGVKPSYFARKITIVMQVWGSNLFPPGIVPRFVELRFVARTACLHLSGRRRFADVTHGDNQLAS